MKINSLEQLVGLCPSVQELVLAIEDGEVTAEDILGIDAVIFETVDWTVSVNKIRKILEEG